MDKIGKFTVYSQLGAGSSSTLLKVRRESDGKTYALKVVKVRKRDERKFVAQARREYEVGRQLKHPNVYRVHCFEQSRGLLLQPTGAKLLMEFVDGKPLLETEFPIGKLCKVFNRAARGLTYLHARSVYHADVKPENIMVTADGGVKIIDLGLSWLKGENKDRVQGTPEYMAPEQLTEKKVTAQSDVFNFGATMFRMLTGQVVPEELRDPMALDLRSVQDAMPSLRSLNDQVPPALDQLVQECLQFRAKDRPRTMQVVHDRLRDIRKDMSRHG